MTSYTADFDDIPGTRVFTAQRAKAGYELNQFCMSLMKEANRERFKANERAYLDETNMTEEQKQAVLDRDYNKMIDLGGQIYFLGEDLATDGLPAGGQHDQRHAHRRIPADDDPRRPLTGGLALNQGR